MTDRARKLRVGVVGATGYTGLELLRLLAGHPASEIAVVTSRSEPGTRVAEVFPWLRGTVDQPFVSPDSESLLACDVVFFATPHGTAMQKVPALLAAGVRVVDLSADFRLRDAALWKQWYGQDHHCPELIEQAVYGLPELYREQIRAANLVANPGCYPTAVTLAILPLLVGDLLASGEIIADAKSGVSGAGRKSETGLLHAEVSESFKAYSVSGHRHQPEIEQSLTAVAGTPVHLCFVPHLVPMNRGIHATVYGLLSTDEPPGEVFRDYYRREPFVDVLEDGRHPDTRSVRGTNICRISVHCRRERRVIVLSVIDNLVKGAAGQAIQNMNLMFDLPETAGLDACALVP